MFSPARPAQARVRCWAGCLPRTTGCFSRSPRRRARPVRASRTACTEKADFENRIAQGAFLEHAQYVGNYYGTLEAPVNEKLDEGFDVILEIEVQGAMQIKKKRPDAVMVFIAPPSFEELASRLRGRGTEDEAKVQKRLETAKGELEQKDKFDYVVVNDTVDRAVDEIKGILASRR